jgi:hypothetical protein
VEYRDQCSLGPEDRSPQAGASQHKLGDGDVFVKLNNTKFTLKVTELSPDKRAFHSEWCSPNHCEDLFGAVRTDKSMVMPT